MCISAHPKKTWFRDKCRHCTRDETSSAGGAGGELLPSAPPALPSMLAEDNEAYERRLKLTDIIGFVAQNGYAREASRCAGLNRETWRCIPAGLSAADADRVRRDHPLWQAIINLKHGEYFETRLGWAARSGHMARVRELCDWRADIEATGCHGYTPLIYLCKQTRPPCCCARAPFPWRQCKCCIQ